MHTVSDNRNLPVARGSATPSDVQRDGLEVVECVVQMLDSGDAVEVLDCDADAIAEGQLGKRANSIFAMTRWYVRWFVLKRDTLVYRAARRSPSAKMLDLSGVRECKRDGQKRIRIKHSFRILYLRASSSFDSENSVTSA